jgi:hypothetical protein
MNEFSQLMEPTPSLRSGAARPPRVVVKDQIQYHKRRLS